MPTTTEKLKELNDLTATWAQKMEAVAGSMESVTGAVVDLARSVAVVDAQISSLEVRLKQLDGQIKAAPAGAGGQATMPVKVVRIEIGGASADVPEHQADAFISQLEQFAARAQ